VGDEKCIISCSRCGYRFDPLVEARCPRCFEAALKMRSCSGRCKGCLEACPEKKDQAD
jgi:hypothetical protein